VEWKDWSVVARDPRLPSQCGCGAGVEWKDWSDHALWWPESRTWLVRTRWSLDKYGVVAGSQLTFTPLHKNLRVTLPDLQTADTRVNFSANVFNNVIVLCKKFSE